MRDKQLQGFYAMRLVGGKHYFKKCMLELKLWKYMSDVFSMILLFMSMKSSIIEGNCNALITLLHHFLIKHNVNYHFLVR